MNSTRAKELLSFHSSRNSDIENPKWQNGFLGCLRPFQGQLHEENFTEIMQCLNVLKDEIQAPAIDREIVSDIINIIHMARCWSDKDGTLERNKLLSEEQTKYLFAWIDIIETYFMYLLEDNEEEGALVYQAYLDDQYF